MSQCIISVILEAKLTQRWKETAQSQWIMHRQNRKTCCRKGALKNKQCVR